jgi:hypothetical protein
MSKYREKRPIYSSITLLKLKTKDFEIHYSFSFKGSQQQQQQQQQEHGRRVDGLHIGDEVSELHVFRMMARPAYILSCYTTVATRCQSHQHFTRGFFIQKFCSQLFCTYILGLFFFEIITAIFTFMASK